MIAVTNSGYNWMWGNLDTEWKELKCTLMIYYSKGMIVKGMTICWWILGRTVRFHQKHFINIDCINVVVIIKCGMASFNRLACMCCLHWTCMQLNVFWLQLWMLNVIWGGRASSRWTPKQLPFTFKLIHHYTKWWIIELIYHVSLSLR